MILAFFILKCKFNLNNSHFFIALLNILVATLNVIDSLQKGRFTLTLRGCYSINRKQLMCDLLLFEIQKGKISMKIFKTTSSHYEVFFYLIIIPLIGLGVLFGNYILLALSFILAIPLNYFIYQEQKNEVKEKVFLMNKMKALGVGMLFFLFFWQIVHSKFFKVIRTL